MAKIFMLSPFGEPFDQYFQEVLKPGLRKHGHDLYRADESYAPGVIIQSIFHSILDADLVIADITRQNANVFYELGIAHSYCKQVIIVAQSTRDLPFDVRHMRIIDYDTTASGWDQNLIARLASAIEEALSPDEPGITTLSNRVFSGRYLRRFNEVIDTAEEILGGAENYFFVTRTSPNESILPHETEYFDLTEERIRGTDGRPAIPNYRRLILISSRDSLNLARTLLTKYASAPNFQMAIVPDRQFPVNFEVFISDDKAVLIAFGAEQAGGPLESAMYVRNARVAAKWKSFFLNLWEHPGTVVVKPSGVLDADETTAAEKQLTDSLEQSMSMRRSG